MVIDMPLICSHCKRYIDELFDVGFEVDGAFLLLSRGCEDCAIILRDKLTEMKNHIGSAKLN